ncbi:hypothetical protein Tco_0286623 [Tanacetum coccineum]
MLHKADNGKDTRTKVCRQDDCRCDLARITKNLQQRLLCNTMLSQHIPSSGSGRSHDDVIWKGELCKRQKTFLAGTYVYGVSSLAESLTIVQIIKTYWERGHEHKFIAEIVARRANGSIVSITESDYKNLNKNDIEDLYLLIVNGKVDDYAETGLLWSLSVFIKSIEKYKVFSIVSEPVYGIIYKNSLKEKRVMRHQEVHKLCDATLKRVLEGLKIYNKNVKHGYVIPSLKKEDVEYLQLFEEDIEERLKHRDQMRRWKIVQILKCHLVRPAGRSRDAMSDEATTKTILPSARSELITVFHRNVFPVPPCQYTQRISCWLVRDAPIMRS